MPFVIPVKAMALTVSTLMCGTMFTTYYFCMHDSECPALPKLPTISNTWEDPPGNFLSRVVVSIVALLMALLQPTLFLPAKGKLWCNGTVNLVLDRGAFDYLYLPMDFERGQNRGFAFVNFITPRGVPNFYEEFHGHPLTESSANRRVEIIFADVQGKEENLRESARYRPACFVSDGSHRREM